MSHPHSHPQAVITDEDALNRVSPDQLRGYLTAAGWQKIQDPDYISKSTVWDKKTEKKHGVVSVSQDPNESGYAKRVGKTLRKLAEIEERSQIDIYLDIRSQGPQPVEEPVKPAAADTPDVPPDVPVLLKQTKSKPREEGPLVLGETRTIHDQDGIIITARTRTGKHRMSIAVTSPQLEGILRLRDRFDQPEIVIFTLPHRNKKFYMRYGWANIGEGYETAEEAVKSSIFHITEAVKEGRARLSPGDPEQLAEQMAKALDKFDLNRRQPE